MSDTPRTDAAVKEGQDYWGEYVDPDFARQLEKELGEHRIATDAEIAQWLDDGFSIKVINPEGANYWRCPHCQSADYDGHEQSCLIRAMAERMAGKVLPFAGSARSESVHRWIPVEEGLPADQPGGWLVFDTNAGKLWFETNLPSWWNRKDERGREFDGPTVTHWREDFYPLPGPRK